MKTLRIIFGIAAFSILAGACTNEVELPFTDESESRLTATIEGSPETRTTLGPEAYGVSKVLWSEHDCIGIRVDNEDIFNAFALVEGAGTGRAVFSGYGSGSKYVAVYPFSSITEIGDDEASIVLPSEQAYTEGSFSSGSYPMVAVSGSTDLEFRNLCSVLKVSMTGHHMVTRLMFRSNDGSVKVSGPATVSFSDPANPVLTMSEDGCDSLTVDVGEVLLDSESQKDFYLVLPAQTYKGGFTLRVYTTTGYMDKKLTSDFTMKRAQKHDAKPFSVKLDAGVEPSGALAGSGSEDDPFLISSVGDIMLMRDNVNWGGAINSLDGKAAPAVDACYLLTNDIDLSPLCSEKTGKNWVPIGGAEFNGDIPFRGVFDGGGHEISNLYFNGKFDSYIGLFGCIVGSVRNLTVSGDITCSYTVGLLAGYTMGEGVIENCVSKGSVKATSASGGLLGVANSDVKYCRNEAVVNGDWTAGGIAGALNGYDLIHCTNVGEVTAQCEYVGGLVGNLNGSRAIDCVNYGNVSGEASVGGIAGELMQCARALNSINYGEVSGNEYTGGIVGIVSPLYTNSRGPSIVANCVNVGKVSFRGGEYGGMLAGFLGLHEGDRPGDDDPLTNAWVMNSYWLLGCGDGVSAATGGGPGLTESVFGLTEAQLKGAACGEVLYTDSRGNGYDLLIDALNAGATEWGKKSKIALSGWEYASPGSYPSTTDLEAQLPGQYKPVFEIDASEFVFNVPGGQFEVTVTSSHDYSILGLPDWISQTSAEPVTNKPHTSVLGFTVAANKSGNERKCTLEFTNTEGNVLKVKVTQKAPYMTVSATEASFFSSGGSKTIAVSSSIDWIATVGEKTDWYSISPVSGSGDGGVTITVKENPDSDARGGYITIAATDGSVSYKVSFVQSGSTGGESDDWKELPFFHQSVIMRFTATWCLWCPYMGNAITRAQALYPGKIQQLAMHGSASDLEFAGTERVFSFYGNGGYPTGLVDGRSKVENNTEIEEAAANFVRICKETEDTYGTVSGLAIRSSASGQRISIDLTGYFKLAGKYKITVLIVEDAIVNKQQFGNDLIENYVHNGVPRVAVSNVLGDDFTVVEDVSKRDFHYDTTVPSVCKMENLRVLAYIHRPFGTMPRLQTGNYGDFFIDNCATASVGDVLQVALVGDTGGGGGGGQGNEGVTPGGEIE
jgi:hypothetical protein